MKKILCLFTALSLLAAAPAALASDDLTGCPIADGTVAAVRFVDVTAPYSGTLASFDLESGDAVQAGDELFDYVTTDVYATEDGVVKDVFIQPGDDAAAAMAKYGAVIGVEPADAYRVEASTAGAASGNEYKILHLGETLYIKTTKGDRDEGTGKVTAINGRNYSVQVLTGSFDQYASVNLYRDDNYAGSTCVGRGQAVHRDPVSVAGAGRVSAVYVQAGDTVKNGDRLASFVSADATPQNFATGITSPQNGVVHSVAAAPGQQVWKGEWLCRVDLTDEIEVIADVDETDLGDLKVGDALPVTLDMSEANVLTGTVTQISGLGFTKQNAAYYSVHVSIPAGSGPLGASASVYLPVK